jgi:steroid 5-alpha reductase family enzyme
MMIPESFVVPFASAALAVALFMLLLFIVALLRRDNSVADVGWGIGFVLAALVVLWQREVLVLRQVLVTALVFIWGARLAVHIWMRNRGKGEDKRYAQWRKQWGEHWVIRSFLQVFMLQGALLLVVVAPVLYVNAFGGPRLGWLDLVGVAVWAFGFFWETVGDYQLTRFLQVRTNRGRIMRYGLWRYTRHPNYFGEATMWWGIWLIAMSVPGAWFTIVGPILITFLLLRVSGVTMTEKAFAANPEYLQYQKRTSAFIPWPPRG